MDKTKTKKTKTTHGKCWCEDRGRACAFCAMTDTPCHRCHADWPNPRRGETN